MLLLFLLFGYTGAWLVDSSYQALISILGSLYIIYLAYKIAWNRQQSVSSEPATQTPLNFSSGVITQLLNPNPLLRFYL
jgi:threonine/homoserine/homoserine lactone efflux protein